jgi:transcription elongation GreA/GreB family factor
VEGNVIDKAAIVQAISVELGRQLGELAAALQSATDGATDEHAKPENKYDTRALELSYLAAGQTDRIEALRQVIAHVHFYQPVQGLTAVGPGALVEVEGDRLARWLFVAPFAASMALQIAGQSVQVLSAQAPLARALLGKQSGDVVRFGVGAAAREIEIVGVDGR